MATPVDTFAEAARDYCNWCDAPGQDENRCVQAAVEHIANLYLLALGLRRREGANLELEGERLSDESLYALHKRLAGLPFQYYGSISDPMPLSAKEFGVGDVADDLADIHRDLAEGLSLYDQDYAAEAEWCWRDNFEIHWGRHATDALNALHSWQASNRRWPV